MRFGDIALLLLVLLIGFGFLLSHSINLNDELNRIRGELARVQADLQMLETQRQALIEENGRLTEQVSGLNGQNDVLLTHVEALEAERLALTKQIETLRSNLNFVETANPILAWLISAGVRRAAILFVVPIVPLSFGAVYMITHQKANNPTKVSKKGRESQITFQATLTREELHFIAQHRRSRHSTGIPLST